MREFLINFAVVYVAIGIVYVAVVARHDAIFTKGKKRVYQDWSRYIFLVFVWPLHTILSVQTASTKRMKKP